MTVEEYLFGGCANFACFQDIAKKGNALPNAVNRSLQIKCSRMRAFIEKHRDSLHLHINQLRYFAASDGGT
ncbi:unnamed protein product [Gongylonema pulchrum]|uniref:Helitron_like_N domain-containing protein n=1 Tax=Gongylonema pulchrum TaxID=637853 RepID=A0A183E9A4_9BILA|nr:unnamed protein product [Gongylonema pulchrum]